MNKDTRKGTKAKEKYKLKNWHSYNEGLKKRGSLSIWFEDSVQNNWLYTGKQHPVGKKIYNDVAIEFCLTIRSLFRLPYRQTEGFVWSLLKQLRLDLAVPCYTQLNRRTKQIAVKLNHSRENIHVAVDSTGLKVYGEGEWKVRKYGWSKYRTWRKLHIAVNPKTLTIEALTLTSNQVDDGSQVATLLDTIKAKIMSFTADGDMIRKR